MLRTSFAAMLAVIPVQRAEVVATIARTCAPWDGPAVALYLTAVAPAGPHPAPPYRAITIHKSIDAVLRHRFVLDGSTPEQGVAADCHRGGRCEVARRAEVRFGPLASDGTVAVSWFLDFGAGDTTRGRSRARLRPEPAFCG